MTSPYFLFARRIFEKSAKAHLEYHPMLRKDLKRANLKILADTYISGILLTSLIVSVIFFVFSYPLLFTYGLFGFKFGIFSAVPSLLIAGGSFGLSYLVMLIFPRTVARRRAKDMEKNLPFALMHMSTVAASGVPPAAMFRLLAKTDYGEISTEAQKVVNYIDSFGLDITTAVRRVAANTPSRTFRELLVSINSTIFAGGDLRGFLQSASKTQVDEYKSVIESSSNRLGIAAEVYSVILISGPLLLFVGLSTMNLIWGTIGSFPIPFLIRFGAYFLLPLLNLVFLLFLEVTE